MKRISICKAAIFLFLLCVINSFCQTTPDPSVAITDIEVKKKFSLLIDGGIKDLVGGSSDKTATGLLGVRYEDLYGKYDISYAIASTVGTVQSGNIKDYSKYILNPFNTSAGGASINVNIFRRTFKREYSIINALNNVRRAKTINATGFIATLDSYPELKQRKNKLLARHLGCLVEFNVSNFSWANKDNVFNDGNIIAGNPYLTWSTQVFWDGLDDYVEIIAGVGPSLRVIAGDAGADKEFLESILNKSRTDYLGGQLTLQLYVSNLVAKGYYGIYNSTPDIKGFTNGQFYLSLGLQADIGTVAKGPAKIADLLNRVLGSFGHTLFLEKSLIKDI